MVTDYVKNWLLRAYEDLAVIEAITKEKHFFPNPVCFHAQQAAEKYLKGFLAYNDLHVRKIHDLEALVKECEKIDESFKTLNESIVFLNQFYVESCYPDDRIEVSDKDAKKAYDAAMTVKGFVLDKIEH